MKKNREVFLNRATQTSLYFLYIISWLVLLSMFLVCFLMLTFKGMTLPVNFSMKIIGDVTRIGGVTYNLHSFSGNLSISGASTWLILLNLLPVLFAASLATFIIKQLLNIVKTIQPNGNPFSIENGKRLTKIAASFLIIPPIAIIRIYILYKSLPDKLIVRGMEVFTTNVVLDEFMKYLVCIPVGLIILLIAQVFYEGNRLKQENDLTV